MARRHTPEQIIRKLREAERLAGEGATTAEAAKQLEVSEQTLHRWRRQYGGMKADGAKRLKDLEKENVRLKRIVADQALDLDATAEVARGNFAPARQRAAVDMLQTRPGLSAGVRAGTNGQARSSQRYQPAETGQRAAGVAPGVLVETSALGLPAGARRGGQGRSCATSSRFTVCGARKACACHRSAGNDGASARRPSLPDGAPQPHRIRSGHSTSSST